MMWPLSPAAQAALRGSTQVISARVTVLSPEFGTVPPDLLPLRPGGSVSMDATAKVRASAEVTFADARLWPADPKALLSPFSTELFIERGITVADGRVEWIPMGVFPVVSVQRSGRGLGGIKVSAKDRAATIDRDRFDTNTQAPAGDDAVATIVSYVRSTFPDVEIIDRSGVTAPVTKADFQRDKLGAIAKIAASRSLRCYFDRMGRFVLAPLPTLDDDPAWTVDAGRSGVLVSTDETASSAEAYNRFRVSGVNTTSTTGAGGGQEAPPPPSAVVVDDDPASPFYIGWWDGDRWVNGRMRPATRFYASPLLTTESQCEAVARDLREKVRGMGYTVSFTAVPNPALDPDDVFLARAGYRSHHVTRHLIQSIDHQLAAGGGAQTLNTRGEALPAEEEQQEGTAT